MLLILLLVAGRFLGVDDYGRFMYALAVTTIIETVMDIGLARDGARSPAIRRALRHSFATCSVSRSHGSASGSCWCWSRLRCFAAIPWSFACVYLMGLSSAARSYFLTAHRTLQGTNRFDLEALIVVADRVLLLALGTATLVMGYDVQALGVTFVLARLIAFVAVTLSLRGLWATPHQHSTARSGGELQAAALPLGFFMIS